MSGVAGFKDPILLRDADGQWAAPAFPCDWKNYADAEAPYGIIHPAREMRVRTRIDPKKRTADRGDGDEGGALFALEVVHPFTADDAPLAWHGGIDFPEGLEARDRKALASQLQRLLATLGFVSKTKAVCNVTATPSQAPKAPNFKEGDTFRIVLTTPALIADSRFQDLNGTPKSGALNASETQACYAAAWEALSDGSLELSHAFADQFLAGGNALARRYQKGKAYDPWLLTSAGSVFVFTVKCPAKAEQKIKTWLTRGLDLPTWAETRFGKDWNSNPYRTENGFGEIAVHHFRHPSPEHLLGTTVLP